MFLSIAPGVLSSPFDDIYTNLALEQELFAALKTPLLMLWKNRVSVVVGRYQNPYLECDVAALASDGVSLARRQSGGGTVWHDEGNLCFTFFGPRRSFDRQRNIDLITATLNTLGIPAESNKRLDIAVDGKKISGSAFRETAEACFHHGTLLVSSDLDKLRRYLRGDDSLGSAKGIKSIRSAVTRLIDICPSIEMSLIESALAEAFSLSLDRDAEIVAYLGSDAGSAAGAGADMTGMERFSSPASLEAALQPYAEKMRSREWVFGASPPFSRSLRFKGFAVRADFQGGTVASLEAEEPKTCPESLLQELRARLVGVDYVRLKEIEE
jgi:lipoate-protein ligase A